MNVLTVEQKEFLETITDVVKFSNRTKAEDGHKGYNIWAITKRVLEAGNYENEKEPFHLKDRHKLNTIRNWYIRVHLKN